MKKNSGVLLLATLAVAFSACAGVAAVGVLQIHEPEVVKAAEGDYWSGVDLTGATYGSALRDALCNVMITKGTATGSNSYDDLNTILKSSDKLPSGGVCAFYRKDEAASSWNKEHVWPNSRGAGKNAGYAGADPQVIRPTNTSDNSSRSNYMYGETTSPSQSNGWDPNSFGFDGARGEAARIIFYAATRYKNKANGAGGSYKGSASGLELTENLNDATTNATMGKLSTLMTWNTKYAVTRAETYRNEYLVGKNYARNPFIDHPELAGYIWDGSGTGAYGGTSGNNYIRTVAPTASTSPAVTVASSTASVNKGSSTTVQATAKNFDGTVTWSVASSASTIATATVSSNGLVTISGVKGGSATITVSASYSGTTKSATIAVTVVSSDPTLTASPSAASVKTSATTTVALTATNFSGTPTYSVSSSASSIATGSVSGTTLTISGVTVGSATLTITATSGSETASTTVAVTVTDASAYTGTYHLVTSTSDLVAGKKYLIASAGAAGSASFLSTSITGTYYQGITSNTINSDLSVTPSSSTEALTLGGSADSWTFTTSVRSSNSGMLCVSGTYQNLVAVASPTSTDYSTWSIAVGSGSAVTIKNTAYTAADRYIEYYSGKSEFTTYATASTVYLFVENSATPAKTLSSIAKTGTPTTTSYTAGQSFDPTGITVTATYSDGSTANVTSSVTWTPSPLTAGTTSVTGTYGGKTVMVSGLTVAAAKTLSSIAVTTNPTKVTYTVGDTFSSTGLVITATYSDGTTAAVTGYTLSSPDMSTAGTKTVTVTYSGKTTTFSITVNAASGGGSGTYTLVKSSADLVIGSNYLIASGDASTVGDSIKVLSTTQNSSNRGSAAYAVTATSKITKADAMESITLGGDSSAYTLHATTTAGYLSNANAKNSLKTVTSGTASGATWTISIDSSSYVATITNVYSSTYKNLRYNSSASLFATYSSTQASVYLFVEESTGSSDLTLAKQWAQTFNTAFSNVCNAQGNTAIATIQSTWATQYSNYGNLASAVQAYLTAATSTDSDITTMWAKYTYIYNKYSTNLTSSGGDFLSKGSSAYKGEGLKTSSESTAILVVAGMMAAGLLGFYLLKKKKAI